MPRTSATVLFGAFALLSGCAEEQKEGHVDAVRQAANLNIEFDYAAPTAMLSALERPSLSDSQINDLLRLRGVRAVVENATRFVPKLGEASFRAEMKAVARGEGDDVEEPNFRLEEVKEESEDLRSFINEIKGLLAQNRAKDPATRARATTELRRYWPDGGGEPAAKAYLITGGVSDGFVFNNDPENGLFAKLEAADGDVAGLMLNLTHEYFHVLQKVAGNKVPEWRAFNADEKSVPEPQRLVMTLMLEGLGTLATDATRAKGKGPYMSMWRGRALHNQKPKRIVENFALMDQLLAGLRGGKMTWENAYEKGFTTSGDIEGGQLYFVGYQMGKEFERYEGPQRIRRAFSEDPMLFFRDYITLYRKQPEIKGRFSPETEAFILQQTS